MNEPGKKITNATWALYLVLASVPLLAMLHLDIGPTDISLVNGLLDTLRGELTTSSIIFSEVRVPRTMLAILTGFSLAISGAALQGLLHNPLASPGLLGVSQTASLLAVLVLYYGVASLAWFILPVSAMAGALIATAVIFSLAGRKQNSLIIILAGIAINALAGSFTSLALNFAPNPYAMQEIYFWLLGSLANRGSNEVLFALPFMLAGWLLILTTARFLDAMSLGEESASSLGFSVRLNKILLVCGVALATGASVAVAGNIAFVGLLVPHLVRPLVQHEPGRLLWWSGISGAALMLLADLGVLTLSRGQELQIGVVTAALGGPFFLYLILKNRQWFT